MGRILFFFQEALRAEGKTREAIRFVRDFLENHPSKTSRAVAYYELATTLAESDEPSPSSAAADSGYHCLATKARPAAGSVYGASS